MCFGMANSPATIALHLLARERLDVELHLAGLGEQGRVGERRHERLAQCRDPLGRHACRQHIGPAEHSLAVDQLHHLPVLVGLGEIERARHAHLVQHGQAFGVLLHQDPNHVVGHPLRRHGQEARVAVAAQAVDLLPLDRERDLARRGIAGDDAEFRAEHVVGHRRQVAGGTAFVAGTDDHLLGEHVLEALDRGVDMGDAGVDVGVGATDEDEFRGIVLDRRVGE